MKRKFLKRTESLLILFIFVMLSSIPLVTFADENVYHDSSPDDMITKTFNTDIQATSDNYFHVKEKITVDYITPHHGIYRYIPLSKDYIIENVHVDSGQLYEVTTQSGDKVIKIGSGNKYISGDNTYRISYDIEYRKKDRDSKKDFLYLDLLPTGWDTSIRESSIHLSMPNDVSWENMQLYIGQYGSSDFPEDKVSLSTDERNLYLNASDLKKGEGITVSAELPQNYWNNTKYYSTEAVACMYLMLAAILLSALFWLVLGRDKYKMYRPVTIRPPRGMTPLEVGHYYRDGAKEQDVISMLFYYANKGYIKIHKKGSSYELEKIKDADKTETTVSRRLLDEIFAIMGKERISLKDFQKKIQSKGEENFFAKPINTVNLHAKTKNTGKNLAVRSVIALLVMSAIILSGVITGSEDYIFITIVIALLWGAGAFLLMRFVDYNNFLELNKENVCVCMILVLIPSGIVLWIINYVDLYYLRFVPLDWLMDVWGIVTVGYVIYHLVRFLIYLKKSAARKIKSAYIHLIPGLLLVVIVEMIMWEIVRDFGAIFEILMLVMIPLSTFYLAVMKSPSEEYTRLMGEIYGFRNYIEKVDEPRLREQLAESPDYFYDVLPYAVVFGLESRWSKQFTDLGITPSSPSWYDSTDSFVYSLRWTSDLIRSVEDSFHIVSESTRGGHSDSGFFSNSGFSSGGGFSDGGGFSGGGGGGGGGGGW